MFLEAQQFRLPGGVVARELVDLVAGEAEGVGAERGADQFLVAGLGRGREQVAHLARFVRGENIGAAVEHARHPARPQGDLHFRRLRVRAREDGEVPRLEFFSVDRGAAVEQAHDLRSRRSPASFSSPDEVQM